VELYKPFSNLKVENIVIARLENEANEGEIISLVSFSRQAGIPSGP